MDFLTRFFQALFSGIDPLTIALWVRSFIAVIFGGVVVGAIDVLVQILGILQSGTPFVIDWPTVLRTIAIAVIPVLVAFLKKPPTTPPTE